MEVESEEVKAKAGGFEVEEEEKEVVEVKNNLGPAKEASDVLEKKEVHLCTNGSRPASMLSMPNATKPTTDQLTLFYEGKVFVFEAVPEEKVRKIMLIAASAVKSGEINSKTDSIAPASTPVLTRSPSLQSIASVLPSAQPQLYAASTPVVTKSPSLRKIQAELPIARRHSLQQFFEKRRDRLVSKNPYPIPTGKTSETAKDISAEALLSPSCAEKSMARENEIKIEVSGSIA